MNTRILLKDIAHSARKRRDDLGLTQAQLASMAGVSDRLVRQIESGRARGIGLGKLMAVLEPLGLGLSIRDGNEGDPVRGYADSENDEYEKLLLRAVESWGNRGGRHA